MGNAESGFKRDKSKQKRSRINFNDFILPDEDFVHIIGEGAFSKVTCMRKKGPENLFFAIKSMKKSKLLKSNELKNVYNEFRILRRLPHSHFVVNLFYAFHDKQKVYMCTNLMLGGSLNHALKKMMRLRRQQNLLTKYSAFSPEVVLHIAVQLVLALQFLHANRIVHRDIKPDNLLLDHKGHLRITDFNVSVQLKSDQVEQEAKHEDGWGTIGFRAPEIYLREGKGYIYACDWWSVGSVVNLLLTGELPYMKLNKREKNVALVKRMKEEKYDKTKTRSLDKACSEFIESLLKYSPSERLGCQFGSQSEVIILTHEYFSNVDWDIYESGDVLDQHINIFSDKFNISELSSSSSSKESSKPRSMRSSVVSKKPREADLRFEKDMKLKDFIRNFDKSLDYKAVNNHIQAQFLPSKSKSKSSDVGAVAAGSGIHSKSSSKRSKLSEEDIRMLNKFYFNYEEKYKSYFNKRLASSKSNVSGNITVQNNGTATEDDIYSSLQLVSSLKPISLKEYIVNSTEGELEKLCKDMKDFREDYFTENQRYLKSQFETEALHKEIKKLRREIKELKKGNNGRQYTPRQKAKPVTSGRNMIADSKPEENPLNRGDEFIREITLTDSISAFASNKEKMSTTGSNDDSLEVHNLENQEDENDEIKLQVYEEIEKYRLKSDSEGNSYSTSNSDESEIEILYSPP